MLKNAAIKNNMSNICHSVAYTFIFEFLSLANQNFLYFNDIIKSKRKIHSTQKKAAYEALIAVRQKKRTWYKIGHEP